MGFIAPGGISCVSALACVLLLVRIVSPEEGKHPCAMGPQRGGAALSVRVVGMESERYARKSVGLRVIIKIRGDVCIVGCV